MEFSKIISLVPLFYYSFYAMSSTDDNLLSVMSSNNELHEKYGFTTLGHSPIFIMSGAWADPQT